MPAPTVLMPDRYRLGALIRLVTEELVQHRVLRLRSGSTELELRGRAVAVNGLPVKLGPNSLALFKALAPHRQRGPASRSPALSARGGRRPRSRGRHEPSPAGPRCAGTGHHRRQTRLPAERRPGLRGTARGSGCARSPTVVGKRTPTRHPRGHNPTVVGIRTTPGPERARLGWAHGSHRLPGDAARGRSATAEPTSRPPARLVRVVRSRRSHPAHGRLRVVAAQPPQRSGSGALHGASTARRRPAGGRPDRPPAGRRHAGHPPAAGGGGGRGRAAGRGQRRGRSAAVGRG